MSLADLFLFLAFESAFFLIPNGPESLEVREPAAGFSANLLKRKRPEDFLTLPASPAFPSSWVLLQDGAAQFLTADNSGHVRILDQVNLNGNEKIIAIIRFESEVKRH